MVGLQSLMCFLVPEVKRSIGARSAKGPQNRVEGNCVHGNSMADIANRCVTMTFESEVLATSAVTREMHSKEQVKSIDITRHPSH
jgi:hypothetical protein